MTTNANELNTGSATFWELTVEGFVRGTRKFYKPLIDLTKWVSEFTSRREARLQFESDLLSNLQEISAEIARSQQIVEHLRQTVETDQRDRSREVLFDLISKVAESSEHLRSEVRFVQAQLKIAIPSGKHEDLPSQIAAKLIEELKAQDLILDVSNERDEAEPEIGLWAPFGRRQRDSLAFWGARSRHIPKLDPYRYSKVKPADLFRVRSSEQEEAQGEILKRLQDLSSMRTNLREELESYLKPKPNFDLSLWEDIQHELGKHR